MDKPRYTARYEDMTLGQVRDMCNQFFAEAAFDADSRTVTLTSLCRLEKPERCGR
jgi:hypothetical protein